MTPTREEIEKRAFEINAKRNYNISDITPEIEELKEDGSYEEARKNLMTSETTQYRSYIESEARALGLIEDRIELEKQVIPDSFTIDLNEAMKTGVFTSGTSGSGKTVLNFHLADKLMREDVSVYVIDPSQAWPKGSSVPNVLRIRYPMKVSWKGDGPQGSTVFDVSRLTFPQRVEFANKLSKTILDKRKNSEHDPPTFVFFEEGQLYFYQGSMRSMKKSSEAVELVTNGRNYNVRFGVITQFPSMIDKLLVKMCKQRYFGWTSEPNDLDYIEEIIGKEMAKELPKLETGEFVYSYPVRNGCTKKVTVPKFQKLKSRTKTLKYRF